MTEEIKLPNYSDSISSLAFHPTNPLLLLSGNWDSNVYLHDLTHPDVTRSVANRGAVLDVAWAETETDAFVGGLSKEARSIDLETNKSALIVKHDDAVKCVEYNSELKSLITASWDKTLRITSTNSASPSSSHIINLPDKVYSLSTSKTKIVAAMAGRAVWIWDVRMLGEVLEKKMEPVPVEQTECWQKRESSLKFMTRTIKCMPNDEGYVTSSIEGRVAVEFFDDSAESQAKKFAFKCHRQLVNGVDSVYPVSGLAFNATYGTFATGGGDSTVSIWDPAAKKRLRQYNPYPSPISALEFNCDGTKLAVAFSEDDNCDGQKGGNGCWIRQCGDEVKPKVK